MPALGTVDSNSKRRHCTPRACQGDERVTGPYHLVSPLPHQAVYLPVKNVEMERCPAQLGQLMLVAQRWDIERDHLLIVAE